MSRGEAKYEVYIEAEKGENFLSEVEPQKRKVTFETSDSFVVDFRLDIESAKKALLRKMIEKGFDFSAGASKIEEHVDHQRSMIVFSQMVSEEHFEKSKKRHV